MLIIEEVSNLCSKIATKMFFSSSVKGTEYLGAFYLILTKNLTNLNVNDNFNFTRLAAKSSLL